MAYNPFDGKPPQTLGQAIVQNHLGQNNVYTGNSQSNKTGRDDYWRRKKREEDERKKKKWWQS